MEYGCGIYFLADLAKVAGFIAALYVLGRLTISASALLSTKNQTKGF